MFKHGAHYATTKTARACHIPLYNSNPYHTQSCLVASWPNMESVQCSMRPAAAWMVSGLTGLTHNLAEEISICEPKEILSTFPSKRISVNLTRPPHFLTKI